MRIDVVTVFPDLVGCVARCGITGRAVGRGILDLCCWNPRDYTADRHQTVDDRPYGGGPGMVMKSGPLRQAVEAARKADERPARVICLSPQGRLLDQGGMERLAGMERLILLAGRYEGIDERLVEMEVDEEISVGDYVLSGGELPAMVVIDGCARLQPGALGDEESARQDSFSDGLLDWPHYTRPEEYAGRRVPEVLLSGNHAEIARWRRKQSLGRTWERRPELLAKMELSAEDEGLLEEYRCEMKDEG